LSKPFRYAFTKIVSLCFYENRFAMVLAKPFRYSFVKTILLCFHPSQRGNHAMQPKIIKPMWPTPRKTVKLPTDEELSIAIRKIDIAREELTKLLEAVHEREIRIGEELHHLEEERQRMSQMSDAIEEALREPLPTKY